MSWCVFEYLCVQVYNDNMSTMIHTISIYTPLTGCVAAVANQSGLIYTQPLGSFTYGDPDPVSHTNPPMTVDVSTTGYSYVCFPMLSRVIIALTPRLVPGSHH